MKQRKIKVFHVWEKSLELSPHSTPTVVSSFRLTQKSKVKSLPSRSNWGWEHTPPWHTHTHTSSSSDCRKLIITSKSLQLCHTLKQTDSRGNRLGNCYGILGHGKLWSPKTCGNVIDVCRTRGPGQRVREMNRSHTLEAHKSGKKNVYNIHKNH